VDIPSGLFGEDNSENNGAKVRADFTLNIVICLCHHYLLKMKIFW